MKLYRAFLNAAAGDEDRVLKESTACWQGTGVRDVANPAGCFVMPFTVGMNDDLDQKQREAANQRHRQRFGEVISRI